MGHTHSKKKKSDWISFLWTPVHYFILRDMSYFPSAECLSGRPLVLLFLNILDEELLQSLVVSFEVCRFRSRGHTFDVCLNERDLPKFLSDRVDLLIFTRKDDFRFVYRNHWEVPGTVR